MCITDEAARSCHALHLVIHRSMNLFSASTNYKLWRHSSPMFCKRICIYCLFRTCESTSRCRWQWGWAETSDIKNIFFVIWTHYACVCSWKCWRWRRKEKNERREFIFQIGRAFVRRRTTRVQHEQIQNTHARDISMASHNTSSASFVIRKYVMDKQKPQLHKFKRTSERTEKKQ